MFPIALEEKDTTESNTSASYVDLFPVDRGWRSTSRFHFDDCDVFNFHKLIFSFPSNTIPSSPIDGVLSHSLLMRYIRACSSYWQLFFG